MKDIYILNDYKDRFGSKVKTKFFREGFDKDKMRILFLKEGFNVHFCNFHMVNFSDFWENKIILYTSSEDINGCYKSYIEDVILGLEMKGAICLPAFHLLKAHNNKVFMEILRYVHLPNDNIQSLIFGTIEEIIRSKDKINYPVVIKSYEGAVSRNVKKCNNFKELIKTSKKIMRTLSLHHEIREIYRAYNYKPYVADSKYRKKIIVQNMINGLVNDWKVLIFGNKYYKLKRMNRNNDFRASGSGIFTYDRKVDSILLDYCQKIYKKFDVPILSIDVAKKGNTCYLIEFQFLYFGTRTMENSDHYYTKKNNKWVIIQESSDLEKEYVKSHVEYINRKYYCLGLS